MQPYRQQQSEILRPHAILSKCLFAYQMIPHRIVLSYFTNLAQLRETMNMNEATNAVYR